MFARTRSGSWLRYPADAQQDFSRGTADIGDRAGSVTPYGGTLADAVFGSFPTAAPKVLADGTWRYTLDVSSGITGYLLPDLDVRPGQDSRVSVPLPFTVDVDKAGRLARATADLTPLLKVYEVGTVNSLRAELTFGGFGAKVEPPVSQDRRVEDATRVLTLIHRVKPGTCAGTDTGIASYGLVRVVDCSRKHDLSVFGQLRIEESSDEPFRYEDGYDLARKRCDDKFSAAPAAWTAGADS